ncbi:hypothetical protein CB1_002529003 [Camelus ferus]|nr:hypothetical protein CB1_002529003 [Camelus ferus]
MATSASSGRIRGRIRILAERRRGGPQRSRIQRKVSRWLPSQQPCWALLGSGSVMGWKEDCGFDEPSWPSGCHLTYCQPPGQQETGRGGGVRLMETSLSLGRDITCHP